MYCPKKQRAYPGGWPATRIRHKPGAVRDFASADRRTTLRKSMEVALEAFELHSTAWRLSSEDFNPLSKPPD